MFERVVVGVGGEAAGRDAIALGKLLISAHGELALLHAFVDRPVEAKHQSGS